MGFGNLTVQTQKSCLERRSLEKRSLQPTNLMLSVISYVVFFQVTVVVEQKERTLTELFHLVGIG